MSTIVHPSAPDRHAEAELWGHQEWFMVLGCTLMLLGLVGVGATLLTTLSTPFFLGWLMLAGGLVNLFNGCRFWGRAWASFLPSALVGLTYAVAGALVMVGPGEDAAALRLLLSDSMVLVGVFRILAAAAGWAPGCPWTLVYGMGTLAIGVLIRLGLPESGLWTAGIFVGVDLLVGGWAFVAAAATEGGAPPSPPPGGAAHG